MMEEVLRARSLPEPIKMAFCFWKVLCSLQITCIFCTEQSSKADAAFQQIRGTLLVTALRGLYGKTQKNQLQGAELRR